VRIAIAGAGPAGLLFALLARRRHPRWQVEVFEQNPPGATFGFGVVFSEGALAFLERDAPDLHRRLTARMEAWPMQRIVHRGQAVDIDGNGFAAIARLTLLQLLQLLCREAGVALHYDRTIAFAADLGEADLVVAADGVNSILRAGREADFGTRIEWLGNRFAWYGVERPFECLSLTFRGNADGAFVAHHYRYAPRMSTFLVECDQATWRKAGLDAMSDAESRAYCERVFAAELGGRPLISNKSVWRCFPLLCNERWSVGNMVLLGDAQRTLHFSIGSGTRAAFEDAIALDRAFGEAGANVPAALAAFERSRRPVLDKLLDAANRSSYWYEQLAQKMARFDALGLAYDYMRRSGRLTDARLAQMAPKFMAKVAAAR